jgi:hypothetical protein
MTERREGVKKPGRLLQIQGDARFAVSARNLGIPGVIF